MMKNILFALFFSLLLCTPHASTAAAPFSFGNEEPQIAVNNRVLAIVNEKAISVFDLAKKMDMVFYREYPQYASSASAKFQFYQASWRQVLNESIDKELILAEAKDLQLSITNGDIREEMEAIFGPNIIENLENASISYSDAWDLIESDLILKRMLYFKVNTQVLRQVTPEVIKESYAKWCEENKQPEKWVYQVISIRGNDPKKVTKLSEEVHHTLVEKKDALEEIAKLSNEETTISVSSEYAHPVSDLSETYKNALANLEAGTFSTPSLQTKKDAPTACRIFHLKEILPSTVPPLSEVESLIRDKLFESTMIKENQSYITHLRKRYHFDEADMGEWIPKEFEPFALVNS